MSTLDTCVRPHASHMNRLLVPHDADTPIKEPTMLISSNRAGSCAVTFTWREPDGEPPHDVLLRLLAYAEDAHEAGELDTYLMNRGPDGRWTITVSLPSDLRTSYQFCPVTDEPLRDTPMDDDRHREVLAAGVIDPSNPHRIGPSTFPVLAPASVLELPDAVAQPWHRRRTGTPEGKLTRIEMPGDSLVSVYTPATGNTDERLPVAIVLDGRVWRGIDITTSLDNLIAAGAIPPTVVALVESIHGLPRVKALPDTEVLPPFLTSELLPLLRDDHAITDEPARTVLAGQSLGGLAAVHAGLHLSNHFGLILSQSGSFWWPGDDGTQISATGLLADFRTETTRPTKFFIEAGQLEKSLVDTNRQLRDVLRDRGYDFRYREYNGGHDYACWRGGLADGLIALLGEGSQHE